MKNLVKIRIKCGCGMEHDVTGPFNGEYPVLSAHKAIQGAGSTHVDFEYDEQSPFHIEGWDI